MTGRAEMASVLPAELHVYKDRKWRRAIVHGIVKPASSSKDKSMKYRILYDDGVFDTVSVNDHFVCEVYKSEAAETNKTPSVLPPPGSIFMTKYETLWYCLIVPDEKELEEFSRNDKKKVRNTNRRKFLMRYECDSLRVCALHVVESVDGELCTYVRRR